MIRTDRQPEAQIWQFQAIASIRARNTLKYIFFRMRVHLVKGGVWSITSRAQDLVDKRENKKKIII